MGVKFLLTKLVCSKETSFCLGLLLLVLFDVFCISRMLSSMETAEDLQKVSYEGQQSLLAVEKCPKPVVAAIMGSCLGGGLEVM